MTGFFCKLRGFFFICCLVLIIPANGFPVNFSISPIRVFFDEAGKTHTLTIKNESDEAVTLQLKAVKWEQDEDSRSVYSPTKDIIFFPKLVSIEANRKKIIRLGTTIPRDEREKTYRLFIEEIPRPGMTETTAVNIVMKIGVPVFVSPLEDNAKGEIETAILSGSKLQLKVKNEGNVHFAIRSIKITGNNDKGEKIYSTEIGGGYVHEGRLKGFSIKIPEEKCLEMRTVDIDIRTDRLSLGKKLDIVKKMCSL